jgi:hypothetical protein
MLVERRHQPFPIDFLARVGVAWAIVCALLVLVAIALSPATGGEWIKDPALVATQLVTLGLTMLLAARIAWRLLGEEETTFTVLIIALSIPVISRFTPLETDTGIWQLVCVLAAVNGLMARSPVLAGRIAGTSLAVGMAISIEVLPLATAVLAILALRWLRDGRQGSTLVSTVQSMAVTGLGVFGLSYAFGNGSATCDAVGPVHLAMFGWSALVLSVIGQWRNVPVATLLAGFTLAGGGALALLLYAAPECASAGVVIGSNDGMAGLVFWHQTLTAILPYAVTPAIGIYASINLTSHSHDWLRGFWRDYTLILVAAFALSLVFPGAGSVACALAAVPLAWQLNRWLRAIRSMTRSIPRAGALVAVACALLPTLPLLISQAVAPI